MKKIGSSHHIIYITIIVVLLIVMLSGFYFLHKKSERRGMMMVKSETMQMGNSAKSHMGGMVMTALTPPPVSDQQTQQLTMGTSVSTTQKTFNITGGNFYFVPNKITVNKGDQVTFVMTNAGGVHDLLIDELGVKTPVTHTAEAATATFTASRAGSFVFYCSLPGHRSKGMWGTLIVQ